VNYPPAQPPYGYGYGPQYRPPDHPQATTILVLGILGFFCGVLGPFAWVLGRRALTEIDASGGTIGGRSNVQVGYILGIVTSILFALSLIFLIVYFVFIGVLLAHVSTTPAP
jgi:hypothetical protein